MLYFKHILFFILILFINSVLANDEIIIKIPEIKQCENHLNEVILETFDHTDECYINKIVPIICENSYIYEVDYIKFATIITLESNWIKQKKNNGKYIPSKNNYGPCQINGIHAKEFGVEYQYNLEENIRLGIYLFSKFNSYKKYNGGENSHYDIKAKKIERVLRNK